jgi:hypothetical protein
VELLLTAFDGRYGSAPAQQVAEQAECDDPEENIANHAHPPWWRAQQRRYPLNSMLPRKIHGRGRETPLTATPEFVLLQALA